MNIAMGTADDRKRMLALAGAAALAVSPFTPLMQTATGLRATLMSGHPSDATTLFVLAAISAGFALVHHYGVLWLTGGGALVLLASAYINLKLRLTPVSTRDDGTVAEALASGAFLSWGWIVLLLGTALLLSAAALREQLVLSPPRERTPDLDDLSDLDLGALTVGEWSVVAGQATGATRNALRGILWEMDRNRSEAEIQRLLNGTDIIVASGLTAEQANQLMTRLHDAGVVARKQHRPSDVAGLTGGRK